MNIRWHQWWPNNFGSPIAHFIIIDLLVNYVHLSCQNENFLIFNILAYEISVTTEPIELKFSGIREGGQ